MNPVEKSGLCSSFPGPGPQRIFPENPLHQVVGFGTCRRSRETRCGAFSMWTCTGVSHKPHTITENEWMLLRRRKHNLSIGSPQCKKRASVLYFCTSPLEEQGASELGPLGKLAGFWSQALIGSVMAARNPPESGTRPGPFRRDTRSTDWLSEIYETKGDSDRKSPVLLFFCGGDFPPAGRFHLASSSDAEGTIQFQHHVEVKRWNNGVFMFPCSFFTPRTQERTNGWGSRRGMSTFYNARKSTTSAPTI